MMGARSVYSGRRPLEAGRRLIAPREAKTESTSLALQRAVFAELTLIRFRGRGESSEG